MAADKPIAPAGLFQVSGAGSVVWEKALELWERLWELKIRRGSKPGYTRSRVGAARADDATLIFSGVCKHGSECWRGGEAVAK
jgi:hypothetical protein